MGKVIDYQESPTALLVDFILKTGFQDLPPDAVEKTKQLTLDTIGAALGGYLTDLGAICLEMVTSLGGNPESTIIGSGRKTSCANAAFVNLDISQRPGAVDDRPDARKEIAILVIDKLNRLGISPRGNNGILRRDMLVRECRNLTRVIYLYAPDRERAGIVILSGAGPCQESRQENSGAKREVAARYRPGNRQ